MTAILAFLATLPRWAYYAAAAAALVIGCIWWLNDTIDDAVVADREASRVEATATTLEAERTANRNDAVRREERETQAERMEKTARSAERSNPDEAASPAGPVTRSVLECLRTKTC